MVPHLTTALKGPINELEQRIIDSMPATERWFRLEWMEHTPPFYTSVDIRNAGFKLASVDTNLYPQGWNNLSEAVLPLAVQAAQAAIEKICPEARNLLLVPENHTNNTTYLSSIAQLVRIFRMAGLNVRLGSISSAIKEPTEVEYTLNDTTESLLLEPVIRTERRLGLPHFDPCTIVLNNDLRLGVPGILEDLHEQYLLPPLHAGWHTRLKSQHFACYEDVAKRFGKLLGIDSWLINPMFNHCGALNCQATQDIDCLRHNVDVLLSKIRKKYKEYGIQDPPFVVVKINNGTGGAGIMTVRNVAELDQIPMHMQLAVRDVKCAQDIIVQEGVLTHERINEAVAEPVVYMMDRYVVGSFYRIHASRKEDENLNAPGVQYVPLTLDEGMYLPQPGIKPGASTPNRFYMYGVIARLAMLAASYELEQTDPLSAELL